MLPDLADLRSDAHVVALPMRVRFRGITVREALVLRGPAGWTEFSPFVEYDDTEAAAWLRAAVDFGWSEHDPAADSVPVNATVPAIAPEPSRTCSRGTRAAGPPRSRSPSPARRSTTTWPGWPRSVG